MDGNYDLIIIGAGSAGLTAAGFAVQIGARVALVEKSRVGGDCTWTGCVPSKTLLKTAKVAQHMRSAGHYGLVSMDPVVDLKSVMAHVRRVIGEVYQHENPDTLRAQGIDVLIGTARFLDPHTLVVGESTLAARHILLATGAFPHIPPIEGLDRVNYLTYETIWDLEILPRHLLIVGGGPIGCEMAQAFRRLGAEVTILAGGERLLPRDEPMASYALAKVFTAEGIDVRYKARAERVRQESDNIHLVAGGSELVGDTLLLAVGRRPNVDGLALENARVAYNANGIQVDHRLRTTQQHIYAAGDCIGSHQFTHYAGWQAFISVRNALLPGTSRGIIDRVPWTTFTDPEIAHVGLTEEQAREQFGDTVMLCHWSMEEVDRALTERDTAGFIKLVLGKNGKLLGATIVAERAGEMIHEWLIALQYGLKVGKLANVIHVYPTYSTASMQAAADIRVGQLLSGTSGQVIRGLARLMR